MVDSPFNGDSKNIFFQGSPNFGEGGPENLGKMGNNRDIYCYANWGEVNFEREYWLLQPSIKILVVPQFSYMPDQILENKRKNSIFRPRFDPFYESPLPKY